MLSLALGSAGAHDTAPGGCLHEVHVGLAILAREDGQMAPRGLTDSRGLHVTLRCWGLT